MTQAVKFTATKLVGTGKAGVLKPDANGYYEMVIGGLNTFNSAGEYYTLEGAQALFESSSAFMRRVQSGCLKGEVGHPKKQSGWTIDEYLGRIMQIEETNVCCHFAEIWLDPNYGRNNPDIKNPNMVAIMAKFKPAGPQGNALREALENGLENVCFSIRALTRDHMDRGQVFRVLNTIFTFDWVTEPGINSARKWNSPALESLVESFVTFNELETAVEHICHDVAAMESSRLMANEALESFKFNFKESYKPNLVNW